MKKGMWKAAALAIALGAAPILTAAPADAGSVTIKVTPKGNKGEKLLRGFERLSRIPDRRNKARVEQNGGGNSAEVSQQGQGNRLGVFQRGSGHSAIASQDGDNNTLGIFQFGKNTSTNTTQTGNGKSSLIFQRGW